MMTKSRWLVIFLSFSISSCLEFEFDRQEGALNCADLSTSNKKLYRRSVLECALECQDISTCRAFNFFPDLLLCHYFLTFPSLFVANPQCTTYMKLCPAKDGLDPSSQCAIPFTYQGKLYEGCIDMTNEICDLECFNWDWIQKTCQTPNSFLATYSSISRPDLASFPLLTINDWIVIQNRPNLENFKRTYAEYIAGFTSSGDSYWVGLSSLHTITNSGNYRLRFEVQSTDDNRWYSAEYENFVIDSATTEFVFHAENYIGDANDAVYYKQPTHTMFTIDGAKFYNHDKLKTSCEYLLVNGGFWFNSCNAVSLNADPAWNYWFLLPSGGYHVKASKMMIKLVVL